MEEHCMCILRVLGWQSAHLQGTDEDLIDRRKLAAVSDPII